PKIPYRRPTSLASTLQRAPHYAKYFGLLGGSLVESAALTSAIFASVYAAWRVRRMQRFSYRKRKSFDTTDPRMFERIDDDQYKNELTALRYTALTADSAQQFIMAAGLHWIYQTM